MTRAEPSSRTLTHWEKVRGIRLERGRRLPPLALGAGGARVSRRKIRVPGQQKCWDAHAIGIASKIVTTHADAEVNISNRILAGQIAFRNFGKRDLQYDGVRMADEDIVAIAPDERGA